LLILDEDTAFEILILVVRPFCQKLMLPVFPLVQKNISDDRVVELELLKVVADAFDEDKENKENIKESPNELGLFESPLSEATPYTESRTDKPVSKEVNDDTQIRLEIVEILVASRIFDKISEENGQNFEDYMSDLFPHLFNIFHAWYNIHIKCDEETLLRNKKMISTSLQLMVEFLRYIKFKRAFAVSFDMVSALELLSTKHVDLKMLVLEMFVAASGIE
jgi:hypothetical protein